MELYPRFVDSRVRNALSDTRVVLLSGPRQAGKTTLVRDLSSKELVTGSGLELVTEGGVPLVTEGMAFYTLDNTTTLEAAEQDPVGFIRGIDRAVIDEIQRAPKLLLAIKESVDTDRRPGRFLLTGSTNLMTLPSVADSLAGRMEVVRLLPLAQSELMGHKPTFLTQVFQGQIPSVKKTVIGDELVSAVAGGGYPEALSRTNWSRRQSWYLEYVDSIVKRDAQAIGQIDQLAQMPDLLRILAHHSGQLTNYSSFGSVLGISHTTAQKYVGIFEQLYLISILRPWHNNKLQRLVKTPKLHFLDSGLQMAMCDINVEAVLKDKALLGAPLETFVFSELLKMSSWHSQRLNFFHFRDKDSSEVDIVIEDMQGRIVGVEVKASATAKGSDFKGLRKLAAACGNKFILGLVLYDHEVTVPFGENLFAAPISSLWN